MAADAYTQLVSYLTAWARRRRLRAAAVWIPRGALLGLLLAAVVALVARFRPLATNNELALVVLLLALAGMLLGATFVLLRRYPLLEQARFADQHLALKERLSTAVEIEQALVPTSPMLAQLQLDDALQAAQQVDPVQAFRVKWNFQEWIAGLLLIQLLLAAVFWENPQAAIVLQQRAVAEAIAEQRAELESVAKEIRQNSDLTEAQQEALLEPLEEALALLDEQDISQEEAVAALSQAEMELRELGSAAESLSAAEALAEAAGSSSAETSEGLEEGDPQAAAESLSQLAQGLAELSSDERVRLAEELVTVADAVEPTEPELAENLRDAADALAAEDLAAAEAALNASATQIQADTGRAAAAEQATAAADQLSEGREAVAAAGQPGEQATEAAAGAEAAGESGESPGSGETATDGSQQAEGAQPGSGPAVEAGGSVGGPGQGGGHTEDVFVPELRDLSDLAGVEIELPAECRVDPSQCGSLRGEMPTELGEEDSTVPYVQVYGDYLDVANETLEGDYIPLGLKDYVRDYFSSLEPSG